MSVKLNYKAFRALRKSLEDELLKRGQKVADACGDGYKAEAAPSKNRARVVVYADTPEAIADNGKNLTLLKNIGKAR